MCYSVGVAHVHIAYNCKYVVYQLIHCRCGNFPIIQKAPPFLIVPSFCINRALKAQITFS